jgi:hypothetical protein
MTLNSTIGLISTIALSLPVLCIVALRLTTHRSFIALLIYYLSALIYNFFTNGYVQTNPQVVKYWGLANNLLDAPLMLYFTIYFRTSKKYSTNILRLIGLYIVFEAAVLAVNGFNSGSITVILGPGLLIVFGLWIGFFVKQARMAIENKKATGKALTAAAMVFGYGCYLFIYLMYYIFKTHIEKGVVNQAYVDDTFLVFYLGSTFSSLLLATGLLVESKRVQKLYELKITRRELSSIYTNTKAAAPYRTAVLDFDKELLKN